mgnify:CR=1 FL=1
MKLIGYDFLLLKYKFYFFNNQIANNIKISSNIFLLCIAFSTICVIINLIINNNSITKLMDQLDLIKVKDLDSGFNGDTFIVKNKRNRVRGINFIQSFLRIN